MSSLLQSLPYDGIGTGPTYCRFSSVWTETMCLDCTPTLSSYTVCIMALVRYTFGLLWIPELESCGDVLNLVVAIFGKFCVTGIILYTQKKKKKKHVFLIKIADTPGRRTTINKIIGESIVQYMEKGSDETTIVR